MSKVEFELDTKAVKTEILQADWMKQYVEQEAQSRMSSGQHIKSFIGFDRAKAIIYPDTENAK